MSKQISEQRKTAYYIGTALMILGALSFASTFVSFALNFGNFNNMESVARSMMLRAFGGMGLIFLGGIVRIIGARGLAGSGVVLNPGQARKELEPYSRMAGGMVKDALDEANIDITTKPKSSQVIMLKCTACGQLNEEDSKFCQECGEKL